MQHPTTQETETVQTILVTGATGGQGGAVARRLLRDGCPVRALVRDPATAAARRLRALGAELAAGDLDDPSSLRAAARGVHGVFSVQPADLFDPRPEVEIERGRNVVEAAREAGAAHLVYSSVAAVGRGSGVTHFDSKAEIEAYVSASGVPATVLRPVFFMENWLSLLPEPEGGRRIGRVALDPSTPLQMTALADIGRIAAEAFRRPVEMIGTTVGIAGDELTVGQVAEAFTRADGVPTRVERLPAEALRAASQEMARMFEWFGETGYDVDVDALRARYPGLLTLDAWLRGRGGRGNDGAGDREHSAHGPGDRARDGRRHDDRRHGAGEPGTAGGS